MLSLPDSSAGAAITAHRHRPCRPLSPLSQPTEPPTAAERGGGGARAGQEARGEALEREAKGAAGHAREREVKAMGGRESG